MSSLIMSKPGEEKYFSEYKDYLREREKWQSNFSGTSDRFVPIEKRKDTSGLSHDVFKSIEKGKYLTEWRGVPMSKDPFDCAIYEAMLWDIKPRTVIEVGTMSGGSTLWLADHVHMLGLACHVIAFDRDMSHVHPKVPQREGITFLTGDSNEIEKTFIPDMLEKLPHPWLIIEDAHANVRGVLEHFYQHMASGDYFAVEDTHPETCVTVMNIIRGEDETTWGYDKMNILRSFLSEHPDDLMVDTYYTDRFGYNVTFNMNGYIRKM